MQHTMIAIDTAAFERLCNEVRELRETIDRATITPAPDWMPIRNAADHFGVTSGTLRRWIREGRIEARGSGSARQVKVAR